MRPVAIPAAAAIVVVSRGSLNDYGIAPLNQNHSKVAALLRHNAGCATGYIVYGCRFNLSVDDGGEQESDECEGCLHPL